MLHLSTFLLNSLLDTSIIVNNVETNVNDVLIVKRISGIDLMDSTMTGSDSSFVGIISNTTNSTGTSDPYLEAYRNLKYDATHDPNQYLFQNMTSSVLTCGGMTLTQNYHNTMRLQYGYFLPEMRFNNKVTIKVMAAE